MKIIQILLFFMLFAVLLSSCDKDNDMDKNTGILADSDKVSSILKDLEDKENSSLAEDGDVFWTPSGTIWHNSALCSYLSSSKTVYHGSIEEAKLEGKTRECTRCFASEEDRAYSEIEGNPIEEGDVFFTRSEKTWHRDINCTALRGAEQIYNASVEKAKELGKTVSCDECK